MIDKSTMVSVTNRTFHSVGYTLWDGAGINKIRRRFSAQEQRMIPYEELERLYFDRGGKVLLRDSLRIDDKEIAEELLGKLEPEYFYSEKDVRNIVTKGSTDALKDMLDFGPESVKEMAANIAIKEKLDSYDKREAIHDATGINVTTTIELTKDIEPEEAPKTKVRRVEAKEEVEEAPVKTEKTRRTELPSYNVISE